MTFFVSSGNSSNPPINQQLSPFAPAFVTNSIHCKPSPALSAVAMNSGGSATHRASNGAPPPFSLSAGGDGVERILGGGNPNNGQSLSANQPYSANQQQSVNSGNMQQKRMGTDPSKFKTTICRNWEQTGMCGFRGCTFAHGVDDLRPPMRNSVIGTSSGGPGHSPLLLGANRSPGGNSNTSAAHNAGAQSCTRLDQLIEQFVGEISKEKDLMLVHQEAFRTLKAMMRREQSLGLEAASKVASSQRKIDKLVRKLRDKDKVLLEMTMREDIPSNLKARAEELHASTEDTVNELMSKISECISRQMTVDLAGGGPNEIKEESDEGRQPSQILDTDDGRAEVSPDTDQSSDRTKPHTTRSYAAAVAGGGTRARTGGLVPIGGDEHEAFNQLPSNSEKNQTQ
eukprot:Tbor_TRINITY_DN1978_c0_g2::TRINITY_DN1978_c0_g2_i2::g.3459::m.3459